MSKECTSCNTARFMALLTSRKFGSLPGNFHPGNDQFYTCGTAWVCTFPSPFPSRKWGLSLLCQLISDVTISADETNITSTDYATNPSTNPNSHTTPGKADKHNTLPELCTKHITDVSQNNLST